MTETLKSVGIDIGTSTTQLVVSDLTLENRASPFSVPRIAITEKKIVYRSDIHFTPLLSDTVIDAVGVGEIVAAEYQKAGLSRTEVQTGAVIITGETARKENAREVLAALSDFAGDFVVATAGPDLEAILAARGAGADVYSKEQGCTVFHVDIGGGTSNWALYRRGTLNATGCLDVGGRLVKLSPGGAVIYVSPVLGDTGPPMGAVTPERLNALAERLTDALARAIPPEVDVLSFSGGVADCMWSPPEDWLAYGDMGVLLGGAIRRRFEQGGYTLMRGRETIRATVVGAGAHAMEVSGSTIFYRGVTFPLKNLPVLRITAEEEGGDKTVLARAIGEKLRWYADEGGLAQIALALTGAVSPPYRRVVELADGIRAGLEPLMAQGFIPVVVLEHDMAKTLGQALYDGGALLCLDGVAADNGDYIDIGAPVAGGSVLPVVVKTLAFQKP